MKTWIDLAFADGVYTFKLGLGQIAEIERKCDAGIGAIYARCLRGRYGMALDDIMPDQAEYRFSDLIEVIRQGLIGGGSAVIDGAQVKITAARANELIDSYVIGVGDQRMILKQTWMLAASILMALIEGYQSPGGEVPAGDAAIPTSGST